MAPIQGRRQLGVQGHDARNQRCSESKSFGSSWLDLFYLAAVSPHQFGRFDDPGLNQSPGNGDDRPGLRPGVGSFIILAIQNSRSRGLLEKLFISSGPGDFQARLKNEARLGSVIDSHRCRVA